MNARVAFMRSASIGAFLTVCAAPALAYTPAPADQYELFNRDDTEIYDNFTHLTWQRNPGAPATWANARSQCAAYLDRANAGGFRLATVKELFTLVDEDVQFEYESGSLAAKAIDTNAFPRTPSAQYWSDTATVDAKYWTVDFRNGTSAEEDPAQVFVYRCVRSQP